VIGLASSGLHTNGYSLARKILFERMRLKPSSRLGELGRSVGEELLRVHVSYGPLIQKLLKKFNSGAARGIKGLAHITGGGFIDNIPRVLPQNCDVIVRKGSWEVLPIFGILQQAGRLGEQEVYQVFNMGIGMVLIVSANQASAIEALIRRHGQKAWAIGEVVRGSGQARVIS
jgi:phosphoribosylformylglycinamidine cyclo-ligase